MVLMEMDIVGYLIYFVVSVIMFSIFTVIYVVLTPYDEMALIRKGKGAAVISLSGTLIGFSLTLAACAIYHANIVTFIIWSVISMVVQLLGYLVMVKIIGNVPQHIERNNVAVGSLIGMTGLILGIINAGCLS